MAALRAPRVFTRWSLLEGPGAPPCHPIPVLSHLVTPSRPILLVNTASRPDLLQITAASPSASPASAPLARAASSGAVHRIGERMLRGDVHMLDKVSFTLGVANVA